MTIKLISPGQVGLPTITGGEEYVVYDSISRVAVPFFDLKQETDSELTCTVVTLSGFQEGVPFTGIRDVSSVIYPVFPVFVDAWEATPVFDSSELLHSALVDNQPKEG